MKNVNNYEATNSEPSQTKEDAIDFSGEDDDEKWEGKYGSYEKNLIVDSENSDKVWLENRPYLSGCKHELLCELIES